MAGITFITTCLLLMSPLILVVVVARDPTNITRGVNERDVFIPCPFEFRPNPPVWRIDGMDYISSTLPPLYTLDPGGIYINRVLECMDGYTFQCIDTSGAGLLGQKSRVGVLTVMSAPSDVLACHVILDLFTFDTIELNHQELEFDNGNVILAWKIFSANRHCNISRILAYPQCQTSSLSYDDETDRTRITLPIEISGERQVFNISSRLRGNQEMCPSMLETVSFAVNETETVNLLLGNNDCTCIEIPCNVIAAIPNPNTTQRDILCDFKRAVNDGSCVSVSKCRTFNHFKPYHPFLQLCPNPTDMTKCNACFNNISWELNGTKLDFFVSSTTAQMCAMAGLNPTRVYIKSFILNVTEASANITEPAFGRVCFSSLLQDCNLTHFTLYNVSIVDITGNLILQNDSIPEDSCVAIDKPQCGPFVVLAQPYTAGDYIIYSPVNKTIILSNDSDPCSCLKDNIELQLEASMVDSSRSSVRYSCSSDYITTPDITIRTDSAFNTSTKVQCVNGSTSIHNIADCGTEVKVCGYWTATNQFNCSIKCISLEAPKCTAGPPTVSPTDYIRIVVPVVVLMVIAVIVAVIIALYLLRQQIINTCKCWKEQSKKGRDMDKEPSPLQDLSGKET